MRKHIPHTTPINSSRRYPRLNTWGYMSVRNVIKPSTPTNCNTSIKMFLSLYDQWFHHYLFHKNRKFVSFYIHIRQLDILMRTSFCAIFTTLFVVIRNGYNYLVFKYALFLYTKLNIISFLQTMIFFSSLKLRSDISVHWTVVILLCPAFAWHSGSLLMFSEIF